MSNKPIVKCIADYPNNIFPLNREVELKWNESFQTWEFSNCSVKMLLEYFEKFPHIFEVVKTTATAATWWDSLTSFKRELYIGRHYSDDTPTPDKINTLYKMYGIGVNDCC